MKEMNMLEFAKEIKERRSMIAGTPEVKLEIRDVLSESCLGLCVE